ncbi:MAG: HPr family phosphocarrier protein [Bradymonadales bacterium]|nr:HPr family phosphocarrier protein [Bradymonadales bacterium]
MQLVSDYFTIPNRLGLHLRAARILVELANKFESQVEVEKKSGPKVNAKSILGVLLLEGVQGSQVRVITSGMDARPAMEAISDLIHNGFGEL